MNPVDGGLVIVLALVALRGYLRGLFRELFAIAGLVGGVFVAMTRAADLAAVLSAREIVWPVVAPHVAAVALFVGVYLTATVLGVVVRRIARTFFLGGVDRAGGAVLGLVRGAALAGLALAIAPRHLPPDAGVVRNLAQSALGQPLARLGETLLDIGRRFAPQSTGQAV